MVEAEGSVIPRRIVIDITLNKYFSSFYLLAKIFNYPNEPCPVTPNMIILWTLFKDQVHKVILSLKIVGYIENEVSKVPKLKIF